MGVSVCKWFSPELCKTHSYVLLLCCWGGISAFCTQAAIPTSELPNIQPYKLSFDSFIYPCPAVRVSAWTVLEEEMDRKHSFSGIIPIFFTNQLGCHDRSRQHRKQTLLWVCTHKVSLLSSRCCKNVLKMLSGDISAHFIFVILRKQNLSTRRLTDLRNSIVTGLWCSKTHTKPNNLAGLWLSCFFPIDFVWQRREIALLDWLYECSWCVFLATNGRFLWQHKTKTPPACHTTGPHKWWISRLGNLTPRSSFKHLSPSVCHL